MPNWSPLDLSSELAVLLIESIVRVMVTVSRAVRGVPFKEFRSSVEAKPLAKKFPPSVSSEKLVPLPVNERFAAVVPLLSLLKFVVFPVEALKTVAAWAECAVRGRLTIAEGRGVDFTWLLDFKTEGHLRQLILLMSCQNPPLFKVEFPNGLLGFDVLTSQKSVAIHVVN